MNYSILEILNLELEQKIHLSFPPTFSHQLAISHQRVCVYNVSKKKTNYATELTQTNSGPEPLMRWSWEETTIIRGIHILLQWPFQRMKYIRVQVFLGGNAPIVLCLVFRKFLNSVNHLSGYRLHESYLIILCCQRLASLSEPSAKSPTVQHCRFLSLNFCTCSMKQFTSF